MEVYCFSTNCYFCSLLQIDWENEKSCFQGISAALGNFYALHPPTLPNPSGDNLQFYKRKSSTNPEVEGNCSDLGMECTCRNFNNPHDPYILITRMKLVLYCFSLALCLFCGMTFYYTASSLL